MLVALEGKTPLEKRKVQSIIIKKAELDYIGPSLEVTVCAGLAAPKATGFGNGASLVRGKSSVFYGWDTVRLQDTYGKPRHWSLEPISVVIDLSELDDLKVGETYGIWLWFVKGNTPSLQEEDMLLGQEGPAVRLFQEAVTIRE